MCFFLLNFFKIGYLILYLFVGFAISTITSWCRHCLPYLVTARTITWVRILLAVNFIAFCSRLAFIGMLGYLPFDELQWKQALTPSECYRQMLEGINWLGGLLCSIQCECSPSLLLLVLNVRHLYCCSLFLTCVAKPNTSQTPLKSELANYT